jgi:hypothetical protein
MRKIREAEVAPPSRHNPSSPPELDRLILQALERAPERRLPTAGAFRKGLDEIAARYGLQVSARAVAEWIRQFIQPDDQPGRASGRTPPPESATAILRPSAKERLQRSHDEIALATEIWGEDAQTQAPPPDGPDFSAAEMGGHVPTLSGLHLAAGEVRIAPNTAPGLRDLQLTAPGRPNAGTRQRSPSAYPNLPLPAPETRVSPAAVDPRAATVSSSGGYASGPMLAPSGPYAPHPSAPMLAPTPAVQPRSRAAIVVGALAFVVAAVGGVMIWKSTRAAKEPPPAAPGSQVAMVASDAAAVAPQHDPNDELKPTAQPDAAGDPDDLDHLGDDEQVAVDTPTPHAPAHHPKHASKPVTVPKHVEHTVPVDAALVETPPPAPKPDAAVVVQKPDPPPPPPPPDTRPARTPVVAASAVQKLSGELPTIRGDVDGDALVKMCIDDAGRVSSVKIVRATAQMPPDLTRALEGWRYRPYLNKDGNPSPVCFALSLRVEVKSSD